MRSVGAFVPGFQLFMPGATYSEMIRNLESVKCFEMFHAFLIKKLAI